MEVCRDHRLKLLGLNNESSHYLTVDLHLVISLRRSQSFVNSGDMASESNILSLIDLIKKKEKQVETGQ